MSDESKPKRRVVSKWRYIQYLGTKTALRSLGCATMAILALIGITTMFIVLDHLYPEAIHNHETPGSKFMMIVCIIVLGVIAIPILHLVGGLFARAAKMEPVVPLTRRTATELPEPESLVRASAAPSQQQQTVLLRAAQSKDETPAEELLRPGE